MNTFNRPFDQFRFHWFCSLPFNNLKQVQDQRPEVYTPRYFYITHSVNKCLHQICSLLQMTQPSIACCYVEIVEDLSLLHWFPWKEYSSAKNFYIWVLSNSEQYWRVFLSHFFSKQVGKYQGRICYPNWSKEQWRNHKYSNPHH